MIAPFAFAVLNRARGTKLYGLTASTQIARVAATGLMALLAAASVGRFATLWAALYVWALPGWGKYAGAATTGITPNEAEFPPVEWIVERLPALPPRAWGAVAMGLRMTLAAPAVLIAGGGWLCLLTPLMGLVYWPCGLIFPAAGWAAGDYAAGFVLGVLVTW